MGKDDKGGNTPAKAAIKVPQSGKFQKKNLSSKKDRKLLQRQERNQQRSQQTDAITTIAVEQQQVKALTTAESEAQKLKDRDERKKEKSRVELRAALERSKAGTAQLQAASKTAREEIAKKDADKANKVATDAELKRQEALKEKHERKQKAKDKRKAEKAANKAANEAATVQNEEDMAKRKDTHTPGDEFLGTRIRSEKKKDPTTSSPMKKKQRGDGVRFTENESEEESFSSDESGEVETTKVVPPLEVQDIAEPASILRTTKPTMLEAAKENTVKGVDPFFQAGNSGRNKEGIPPADFANIVFIEPTITVPVKPETFKGTDMKWALQQFTDWFLEAQEQLGPEVSLILLTYRMSHRSEPEAMKDVVKYLKGTQNTISKHVGNFRVNTKMAGEGKSYPMYLRLRVGTNVFGEDLTQLILDLKSVSSDVAVWKSTLQKADVVTLGWWKNSHRNFHLTWVTNWANSIAVQLSAGTCKNTLPGLDKEVFKDRDPIQLGFQWKAVLDGYNKDSRVKAGRKQSYAVHVLAEKKDKSLANVLINALIISPSLFRSSALEFRMAPLYQRENGPAEKLKFLESLNEHVYLQEHLISAVIPDLLSLDIRAPPPEEQMLTEDDPDDSATAIAEKRNPTARTCIMSICKKGMPGVPLFADVGSSFYGEDHVVTFAQSFKEEATFTAANMAAILYHLKGEIALSFFPDYVRSAVQKQGWNEAEDRPVTSGELQLDDTLKPYAENSNMSKMFKFDFSGMEDTPLKDDLQNSDRPEKYMTPGDKDKETGDSSDLAPQKLSYKDAFSVQSKVSAFVNPDGTRRVASAAQENPMAMILLKVRN